MIRSCLVALAATTLAACQTVAVDTKDTVAQPAPAWLQTDFLCSDEQRGADYASSPGCYHGYGAAQYDGFDRRSLYVPVRDGTRLAVDVYLPTRDGKIAEGPLPTVATYSRYWRATERANGWVSTYSGYIRPGQRQADIDTALANDPNGDVQGVGLLLAHGFAFVRAEARGTGASYGARPGDMSGLEAQDGKDILDWIARQPWSTGKVMLSGQSYEGMSQYLVASTDPEPLVAMLPGVATFDEYSASWAGSGVLRKYGLAWLAREARRDGVQEGTDGSTINPREAAKNEVARVDADADGSQRAAAMAERAEDPEATDPMTYFTRQTPAAATLIDLIAKMAGSDDPAVLMEVLYSSERLGALMAENPAEAAQIRALRFARDASAMMREPQDFGPNNLAMLAPAIAAADVAVYNWGGWRDFASIDTLLWHANLDAPKKITMGPWSHGPNEADDPREDASFAMRRIEQLRWADYWLKGIDNGIMAEPEVAYAELLADRQYRFRHADALPLSETRTDLYLSGDGLSATAPAEPGQVAFTVDYTTTLGEQTRYHDAIGLGPTVLPDLAAHAAANLSLTSAPFEAALHIAGAPVVTFAVTSDGGDVVLHAYLERIAADGEIQMLADGVMHSAHRVLGDAPYENLGLPFSDSRAAVLAATPPLSADSPATMTFALQPFAAEIAPGERLRLVVAGAEANTNLVLPAPTPPTIVLHTGGGNGSTLSLPVRTAP